MGCCDGDIPQTPVGPNGPINRNSVRFKTEPLRKSGCTDVPCLFFFVACIIGWIFVAQIAIRHGDMTKLIMAVDSQGLRCGVDSEVLHKPKLLSFDVQKCFSLSTIIRGCKAKSTCVEECPNKTFIYQNCTEEKLVELKQNMKCGINVDIRNANCETLTELVENGKCASYYINSTSWSNICFPRFHETKLILGNLTKFLTKEKIIFLTDIAEKGTKFLDEIQAEWKTICWITPLAIAVCFLYIFLLKCFSKVIITISICGTLGSLAYGTYKSYERYQFFKHNPIERESHQTNLVAIVENYFSHPEPWLYLLIGLGSVLALLVMITLCVCKRICLGIDVIKEGSRVISSTYCSIFWPAVPWLLQIGILSLGIYIYAKQTTLKPYEFRSGGIWPNSCECINPVTNETFLNGTVCHPTTFKCRDNPGCEQSYCHYINSTDSTELQLHRYFNQFMCLWSLFFISAFSELVLASMFAKWYWTYKKSDVPFCAVGNAISRSLIFHTGTLAFGSLIITFCRILRFCVEYVDQQCKKYQNGFTRAIMCVFRCFFWCLENFMKFVSKNAYIMTAIHGTNFCTSAKDAFVLLANNCMREMTLSTVRAYIFMQSKLFISAGMFFFTYYIVHDKAFTYPAVIIGILTYFIADIFFGVYSMAVDTYFMCALVDADENDGTVKKPYYMSRRLSKQLVANKSGQMQEEDSDAVEMEPVIQSKSMKSKK